MENKNISDKPSPQQSNHNKSNTDKRSSRKKRVNWRWLCFKFFIPSIFFIEVIKIIPICSKIAIDMASRLVFSANNLDEKKTNNPSAKKPLIQTRIPEESIKEKAEKISVKITFREGGLSSSGSGLIFKRIIQPPLNGAQKYKYYVLTNSHISDKIPGYSSTKILTSDKKEHVGKVIKLIELSDKYDLQSISFESDREYEIAVIPKPTQIDQWDKAYIFGYPCDEKICNSRKFLTGNIGMIHLLPNNSIKLTKGYSIPYTNETESGMSGSPVMNFSGEVIAIHGLGKNADPGGEAKDSPYLLNNKDQLSPITKETAKLFSWGINLMIINEELSKNLK
jgi:serine protease Do